MVEQVNGGVMVPASAVKVAIAVIVISLGLIIASMRMAPFHLAADGTYPFFAVQDGDSPAYYASREKALTPKYRLQDTGVTLLAFGVILAISRGRPMKAPKSGLGFLAIALLTPLLSVAGYIFDLLQAESRWEFPPWADSLGIPLMGTPLLLVAALVWSFAHYTLLSGIRRRPGVRLSLKALWHSNLWLKLVCALTVFSAVVLAFEGAYCYLIPDLAWLYFYASIAAVRFGDRDPLPAALGVET